MVCAEAGSRARRARRAHPIWHVKICLAFKVDADLQSLLPVDARVGEDDIGDSMAWVSSGSRAVPSVEDMKIEVKDEKGACRFRWEGREARNTCERNVIREEIGMEEELEQGMELGQSMAWAQRAKGQKWKGPTQCLENKRTGLCGVESCGKYQYSRERALANGRRGKTSRKTQKDQRARQCEERWGRDRAIVENGENGEARGQARASKSK